MTDTEIIKTLECCVSDTDCVRDKCPMYADAVNGIDCSTVLAENALDLINRQKAEIEKLKEQKKLYLDRWQESLDFAKQDRAEAIREFAEAAKQQIISNCCVVDDTVDYILKCINNLVKEMTEESDE